MKKIVFTDKMNSDLLNLYINQNKSIKEVSDLMKISYRTIQRQIKYLNLNKEQIDIQRQREKTIIDTYGVSNPYQDKNIMKEARKKATVTMLEKYGVEHNFKMLNDKNKSIIVESRTNNYFKYPDEIKNTELLINWAIKFYNSMNRKPTSRDLAEYQECALSTTYPYIKNLDQYFDIGNFSGFETVIEDFIKSTGGNMKEILENIKYIKNDRTQIAPLELDFYFPDHKVAIEVNDIASHNSTSGYMGTLPKDKKYHYNKSVLCEEKGIRLIHIWEYEWFDRRQRPILENIIKNALGINKHKIYARKCKIEVRPTKDLKDFFNTNNIQGFRGGKFAICLIYNDEIVMSYIMGHCYFGKGKYQWEVIRGATKLGYTVVGGASKIWKYFIDEYNPINCVYYIDFNYFNGNSLPNLGLDFIKTQPGFKNWWVKESIIKNREPARHKEIIEKYKTNEVLAIYNAGTKVYLYEKLNNI